MPTNLHFFKGCDQRRNDMKYQVEFNDNTIDLYSFQHRCDSIPPVHEQYHFRSSKSCCTTSIDANVVSNYFPLHIALTHASSLHDGGIWSEWQCSRIYAVCARESSMDELVTAQDLFLWSREQVTVNGACSFHQSNAIAPLKRRADDDTSDSCWELRDKKSTEEFVRLLLGSVGEPRRAPDHAKCGQA